MFEEFARLVVPELQRRGLFRTEYQGRTLRENLQSPALRAIRTIAMADIEPDDDPAELPYRRFGIPTARI